MPIKVVSVISRMNVGGPAVLLTKLIDSFPENQIQHTLITGTCLPNEMDYLKTHPMKSEVVYIQNLKRTLLPFSDLISFFKMIRIIRFISPDIVHTHTSKAGVIGRIAAIIASPKSKVVHTYHGHLLYGYFPPVKTRFLVLIEKLLSQISNSLVSVSKPVMEDLIKAGIGTREKWEVIHAGVDLSEREEDHIGLIKDQKLNLIWIGRFTAIKNPLLAIESVALLPNELKKLITFTMIGDGELLEDSKKLSRKLGLNIIFTGWVENPNSYLRKCDLLLMTSRNEGMPVVLIEAALQSVPTLSTNVGGIKDFIKSEIDGFLVSESSVEISDTISRLVRDTNLVKKAGQAAQIFAKKHYSLENSVNQHLRLYKKLLKANQ